MDNWLVLYVAHQHSERLADEARRERLVGSPGRSSIVATLGRWRAGLRARLARPSCQTRPAPVCVARQVKYVAR